MNRLDNISRELIVKIDHKGKIIEATNNCYNILGYNYNELTRLNINDLIIDSDIDLFGEGRNNLKLTLMDKTEVYKYFDVQIHPIKGHKDEIMGAELSFIDISRTIKAEKQDFLQILEFSQDIIYMVELEPVLKMMYINSAVTRKLGISVEENYKNPNRAFEAIHPDDKKRFAMKINGELDYSTSIEVRYQHVNGNYIWFEESIIPIYDNKRELIGLVGFCRDIQEQKEMEDRLRKLSYYDCLTGIRNRTYFDKELKDLDLKSNKEIGMILCDLDNLKYINDNLGHLKGDELLKDFATIIDKYICDDIIPARIGGDEFILLLKDRSHKDLNEIYQDLQKSIQRYNMKNKLPIRVSTGFGYSERSIGLTQGVFNAADSKMYENKANNKRYNNDIQSIVANYKS